MKLYIVGNNEEDNNNLSSQLSKLYDIKKFNLNNVEEENKLKEINKMIKENKEWIIETTYNDNSNIISSNATSIIYLNINKTRKSLFSKRQNVSIEDKKLKEFLMKYSNKTIILKSEKEIKKLIDAIYKGIEL